MGWTRGLVWLALAIAACATSEPASPEPASAPAPVARRAVVINEVAAAGVPHDWFEVLNVSTQPVDLVDFVFVDKRDDFPRAHRFPHVTLAPGERHVQIVARDEVGFALGKSDGLFVYTFEDRHLVDAVEWRSRASPRGRSLARTPDGTGAFVTVAKPTRGAPN